MPKFAFYYKGERKVSKVEESLLSLWESAVMLMEYNEKAKRLKIDNSLGCNGTGYTAFDLVYEVLVERCLEKAKKLFKLNEDDNWIDFCYCYKIDDRENIDVIVRISNYRNRIKNPFFKMG